MNSLSDAAADRADVSAAFETKSQDGPEMKPVYIVDDDSMVRRALFFALTVGGFNPRSFASGLDFLNEVASLANGCVLLDLRMPEIDGLEVLRRLNQKKDSLPVVIITGHGEISNAVAAMKLGAFDFLEKPFDDTELFEVLDLAFEGIALGNKNPSSADAIDRVSRLTRREYEVLQGLLSGYSSKQLGRQFNISHRTVDAHRANLMNRLEANSFAEVVRFAILAGVVPLLQNGYTVRNPESES